MPTQECGLTVDMSRTDASHANYGTRRELWNANVGLAYGCTLQQVRRTSDVTSPTGAPTSTPTYAPGTPMWIDHTSPDVAAAARFYDQLFGWTSEDLGEEAGHYTMFRSNGKMVAATTPPMNPGTPSVWSTYIATNDAAATARKVTEAGGQVLMPPFQVMDSGTMAVFTDPTGAVFCVWQ